MLNLQKNQHIIMKTIISIFLLFVALGIYAFSSTASTNVNIPLAASTTIVHIHGQSSTLTKCPRVTRFHPCRYGFRIGHCKLSGRWFHARRPC